MDGRENTPQARGPHSNPNWREAVQAASCQAAARLLAERHPDGCWVGELSSSALSTATAVCAFSIVLRALSGCSPMADGQDEATAAVRTKLASSIDAGLRWLAEHVNRDGGWGDTTLSHSNLSTTALGWACFGAAPRASDASAGLMQRVEAWLSEQAGSIAPDTLARAIVDRYGSDRTFSVPILTTCALAGRLGPGRAAWRRVIPLPFELAAFPRQWFGALRLPVVSYALPALIAIGQARHYHAPSRLPWVRGLRSLARRRTLRILSAIQPENGGFLEATPLTSFVVMSLAGSGQVRHEVVRRGLRFLLTSQRPDGSWPIDTNLATWLTTLSVNALHGGGAAMAAEDERTEDDPTRDDGQVASTRRWLLRQQYRKRHLYTHAAPGGWAWTDLPGGVPDADDTAGALLALTKLNPDNEARAAAAMGICWLLDLQNRDGGIPTFCRGWGALPFDRSSPDITAHTIRAWLVWRRTAAPDSRVRMDRALGRAVRFLLRVQRGDGSWVPLWFGNQFSPTEENPLYGTARVLVALCAWLEQNGDQAAVSADVRREVERAADRAVRWLRGAQRSEGAWGGFPGGTASIEETALALEALAAVWRWNRVEGKQPAEGLEQNLAAGANWLFSKMENSEWEQPSPIGFYFARLWYFERLYPLIFVTGALRRLSIAVEPEDQGSKRT